MVLMMDKFSYWFSPQPHGSPCSYHSMPAAYVYRAHASLLTPQICLMISEVTSPLSKAVAGWSPCGCSSDCTDSKAHGRMASLWASDKPIDIQKRIIERELANRDGNAAKKQIVLRWSGNANWLWREVQKAGWWWGHRTCHVIDCAARGTQGSTSMGRNEQSGYDEGVGVPADAVPQELQ